MKNQKNNLVIFACLYWNPILLLYRLPLVGIQFPCLTYENDEKLRILTKNHQKTYIFTYLSSVTDCS